MQVPKQVLVTDVVARDGFQNEDRIVSTGDKLRVIEGLVRAGVAKGKRESRGTLEDPR